jgi:pSer/pThr/pTyr-binding forkhead associated (FHA) protein
LAEIVVMNGVCAGTVFVLPEIPTVLGRSPESHLQVGDPWISSMHAMFEKRGDDVWVIDLDSRNGTFLGEERIGEAKLADGVLLKFGRTEVKFAVATTRPEGPGAPREERPRPEGQRDTIRADGTLSTRAPSVREPEGDPHALALRPAVILRASLHATGIAGAPNAAERVREALEAVSRAALDEGAVVGRLASVGVLALFGLDGVRPDEVERALRAARAARAAVRKVGGVDLRAGVDAGPVLAGNAGGAAGQELAVLGAAADRCERLAGLAAPGEILVGPGAAKGDGVSPLGPRELGGISVEVCRA